MSGNSARHNEKTSNMEAEKQIVEKKVYEEGKKNYATKGEALGIGIPALVLGGVAAASLFGRMNRGIGGMPENININSNGTSSGSSSPTAFQAWEKECEDALSLTNEMWGLKVNTQNQMYAHREVDVNEKFQLWKSQVDSDFGLYKNQVDMGFGLYKSQRDLYDLLNERYAEKFNSLDKKIAVLEATRPYQDRLIQCEIRDAFKDAINYTDKKTCRAIYGVVGLPSTPTVTVLEGANPFGCNCRTSQSSTTPA